MPSRSCFSSLAICLTVSMALTQAACSSGKGAHEQPLSSRRNRPGSRTKPVRPRAHIDTPAARGANERTGARSHQIPAGWIDGDLDKALAAAKTQSRPLLIFWNARWCPPCNQVKLQVIRAPDFSKVVSGAVLLWLDGDGPNAQRAAERLGLRGYPTLLLLDESGRELMRMVGAVTFSDFATLYQAATSVRKPVRELTRQALTGKLSPRDWLLLAYHDWDKDAKSNPVRVLEQLRRLTQRVPDEAVAASGMLAGRVLEIAARYSKRSPSKGKNGSRRGLKRVIEQVRAKAPKLLDRLLAPGAGPGTAEFLLYWNKEILSWVGCGKVRKQGIVKRWAERLDELAAQQGLGEADRIWAAYANLQNRHLCDEPKGRKGGKQQAFPTYRDDPQAAILAKRARNALASASGGAMRHALVSTAAEILAHTEGPKAAEEVLLAETKRSDTPWYYWAALAWLYEEERRPHKALEAGERAAATAKGRATRIQWQSAQVLRILRLAPADPRLGKALAGLVDLLAAGEDSWVGRNADKVQRVTTALESIGSKPETKRAHEPPRKTIALSDSLRRDILRQARRLERTCSRPKARPPCLALVDALKRFAASKSPSAQ